MYINRKFETRAARMALFFIRHPIKNRGYLAKHERLVTARDLAGPGRQLPSFNVPSRVGEASLGTFTGDRPRRAQTGFGFAPVH